MLDLQALLETIVGEVAETLGCNRSAVLLRDEVYSTHSIRKSTPFPKGSRKCWRRWPTTLPLPSRMPGCLATRNSPEKNWRKRISRHSRYKLRCQFPMASHYEFRGSTHRRRGKRQARGGQRSRLSDCQRRRMLTRNDMNERVSLPDSESTHRRRFTRPLLPQIHTLCNQCVTAQIRTQYTILEHSVP